MERREGPCSPEDGEALRQVRATWNLYAWLLGGPGLLIFLFGLLEAALFPAVAIGLAFLSGAGSFIARRRGWHPAWGLMGIAFLPGLLLLLMLPLRCGWCGAPAPRREEFCPACSAPLGHRLPYGRPPGER